jgi:hypothetical protein
MSGLRPIGSEKLEGLDKIKRIIEISRYNEHVPQPVNENESKEYRLDLADGNTYEIVRERQGYIIKKSINESSIDYIEPIQNRKYFSSYSQALKKLNLMAKEFNTLHENTEGTSLFNEQKKKYKLKVRKPKADAEPVNEPAPAPVAEVPPAPAPEIPAEPEMPPMDTEMPPMGGSEMPAPGGEEPMMEPGMGEEPMMEPGMGEEPDMGEEPEIEDEEIDVEVDKEKGPSEFKRIQILVGKLAQKIRQYEEDKDLSAKDVKYIINSILSALDVEVLDEDDIEQIIAKLEGEEDEEGEEEEVDVDMEEEMPSDMEGEEEPELAEMDFASLAAAQGEVTEYDSLGDAVEDYVGASYGNTMMSKLTDELSEVDDEDEDLDVIVQKMKKYDRSPETYARKQADIDIRDFLNSGDGDSVKKTPIDYDVDFEEIGEGDDENYKLRRRGSRMINPRNNHFAHGTFNESKVDSVLSKYFVLTEAEVEKNRVEKREKQEEIYRVNKKNIIALAESTEQLKSALWYIKHNPESKVMGLSNKGNIVFKEGLNETKITKKGDIL